jgi:hypothetical protein
MVEIYAARFPEHLEIVRAIFREFAESLAIDLSLQDFESELADLPGKFAVRRGRVLLAQSNGQGTARMKTSATGQADSICWWPRLRYGVRCIWSGRLRDFA